MCHVGKQLFPAYIFFLFTHCKQTDAWITLSKQGLIINKTHLSLQSGAQVEGDLLIKGVIQASDYTWISGRDSSSQDVCNSNNIGALRWRNTSHDFFEGCDVSGNWQQVKFCDKDCGFPVVPKSKVRPYASGGPADCQAKVCSVNCSVGSIDPTFLPLLRLTELSVKQKCNSILAAISVDPNRTTAGDCSNITISDFYSFAGQAIPNYFQNPESAICFVDSSISCREENCTDRFIQDIGWKDQDGVSGARWILLKDPTLQLYKFARENDLYYFEGTLYPMSITLHDIITFEDIGTRIWPSAAVAKLPLELWRHDYLTNPGSIGVPFRGSRFIYQKRIPSVFDKEAVLSPFSIPPLTCASFDFSAPSFDYLRVFYNVSGWEYVLPLTPNVDDHPAAAMADEPEVLSDCFDGFRRTLLPPFWILSERTEAGNSSWVGSITSGPPVACSNGSCVGMNCSVTVMAPVGFAVQVQVELDLDAQPAHRGDRFTLVELTADGREVILLDRQGVDPNATAVGEGNVTIGNINGTNSTYVTCGSGGVPCNETVTSGSPGVLVVATQFGSTVLARFQSTGRSTGRGFNLSYGYVSRLALLRQNANATLLQLSLALLEAQGANARGFLWARAKNEILSPAPAGSASLGNMTDAEVCFLCFHYNGSCQGTSACGDEGCDSSGNTGPVAAVEGGPIPAPWSAQTLSPGQVGAVGPLFYQFSARVSMQEVPAAVAYMGYKSIHFVRTEHVSAFPPGTVKAPFAAVLGQRPEWGPYGDKDPSAFRTHPRRAAVGWGLVPVLYGSGDDVRFEQLKNEIFGPDGEFPGESTSTGGGVAPPEWQVLSPRSSIAYISARRWTYDLDSVMVPTFSFVDQDRRLVIANELAMFVPCGMAINNTCGAPCLVTGTALNLLQCGAAVAATRCNEPVVDNCNNECGMIGTRLCNTSALDAGAIRVGSLENSSTATFQLTSQYEPSSGLNALLISFYDPSERCNPYDPDFDPETNPCFYTNRGKFSPYLLTPSELQILSSKLDVDLPIPVECQGRSILCKFNDPLELTVTSSTNSRWKLNGQTLNATSPWWELGLPDKRMSWAEIRSVVTRAKNAQILGVLYVEDIASCLGSCSLNFGSTVTVCRSHCLVALAASLMLTFGTDGSSLQLCSLPLTSGNIKGKLGLWPTSATVPFPPEGNFPNLDRLCISSSCIEFFPTCYISINNIQKMKAMFEARRRSMMREVYNRPGFNLAKIQRLGQGRSGIEISSPDNIAANKPQQRIENTFRTSFLQQIFEKDVLIGSGIGSRIFIESIIDKECPFKFNPNADGFGLQLCISNGTNVLRMNDSDDGQNSSVSGRKNRTITIPDVSGRIITSRSLQDLTSIPGLRRRKTLTTAGTEYPRYGIWPLPRYSKVPDPFSQGNFITEILHNIRPFQGLSSRYCQSHEDGTPILCDQLQQEYDRDENYPNDGDESIVFTGPNLVNISIMSSYLLQNGTTSIEFLEPSQHQKISFPDASALLISSGNLQNVTRTGVLVSPITASSAKNVWTRLNFGVGWESVNITGENNILDYRYTQGSFSFCRSGMYLPKILASNAWTLPNFKICSQYSSDVILFDMGPEWTSEMATEPSGQCLSMYMISDGNASSLLPEVNSLVVLTGARGISDLFNITSFHDICQRNIFGLDGETCANSGSKVSFLDPFSQAAIVSVHKRRYVLCSIDLKSNFSETTFGQWNLTKYRSIALPGGIYSLENITNYLNMKLRKELNNSDVRLNFNIREPKEGLCAERPAGTTYNFSLFHCAHASRYIELQGEVISSVWCNNTGTCTELLSCPVSCYNISNPGSNIQVLDSSTILEPLGIPKPIFAYTFGATEENFQTRNGTLQPVYPGSGYIASGFGRNSGFGLGGDSSWDGFIPPNPTNISVPYTAWCHDGLGYLCFSGCICTKTLVITFSRVLGQTKTKTGALPLNNTLLIPRTADGLLISTGNLEDVEINSSSVSSLHINALRQHETAIGAIVGKYLGFQGPQILSAAYLSSRNLDSSNYIAKSGFKLDHNFLAIHSYQYLTTWVAIYSPDGRCAELIKAIDSNDTETAWMVLANLTFCANRTFSSLQDISSLNASKYSCLEYCASVDFSKEQENRIAQESLAILKSDSSSGIDALLDDPTPYCVSVGCNGTTSSAQNLTIDFYTYGISRSANAPADPYAAAIASRKPCSVVCTVRDQCSVHVRKYLSRRPPPYEFSLISTVQGWDTCVRMIELEAKFTPGLVSKSISARLTLQMFQDTFVSYTNRANQAAFALQQRCSCVEMQGYSSGVDNGLYDVVNHVCQTTVSPVCSSDDILKPFPAGLPWTARMQFSDGLGGTENAVRFLVVPFVSAIILSNMNLASITVDSGSMSSLNVERQTFFNSYVKIGIIREGLRGGALSHGSRATTPVFNRSLGPANECAGCLTAGTCESVCTNAENELVLNRDGLLLFPDIMRTGNGNSSAIRAALGSSQQYEIRFPTWDYDLCNGHDSSNCMPRSVSNSASFFGSVITTGNLAEIHQLSPNFLEVDADGSDIPVLLSGSVEIGSQFSCSSGNSTGYGGRGWSSFAGAGCVEQEMGGGILLPGKSVQQCKQVCESDPDCGILIVNKLERNGLNRAGGQECTLFHFRASKCTVTSKNSQDLYLNFREAPLPWSKSQASNQFFNNICGNTNVSFVPGTPISVNGYLSTGILWRPSMPYSWRYYPDSMCDSFDPTLPTKSYIARYQNFTSIEFCKARCLTFDSCGMVSVAKNVRTCYLLPSISTRRALVNSSDSCGGRESVRNSILDAAAMPCVLQGPCLVIPKQSAELYIYTQNQSVTIAFTPPSKPRVVTFPNASGVVITTGNLYDVSSVWGLQGSDVINYTSPDFTSFSSNRSEFWIRYATSDLQLRTFKSSSAQNYLQFSGSRLMSSRSGKVSGNIILRECDFSPPQTAIWKVENPSFAVSGLPDRDCLAIPGCVMFTNINDQQLLTEAQNSLTQERKSRPGLNAQPTSFRNTYVGTGSGFDSFSYILDFAKPGSRVSNTSCLRNCAGGVPCDRGLGYLPCQRGTLGCHSRCPGYMFPRPGVGPNSPCAGNAVGSFVTGLPCGCAGGSYYQNPDGNTYGTSVCVIPNISHIDNGRFCSQADLSSLPKGWLPAALCCRNRSDVKNCGICTAFPPVMPEGDNNRITFPDTSGTVITTGNMDDLTVLTLQLDNLVISGSLDLGIISQSTTPSFGPEGYHFDESSGIGGIWRTAINLDPYTTKIIGGLPMVAGVGSPGHEYLDPITGNTFAGSAQFYPLTHIVNSPVADLTGSFRNDVVLFCEHSVAFQMPKNADPLLDERERTSLARCVRKREILLPSTSGTILIDSMLRNLSSISIPRQNLLLQEGSSVEILGNLSFGYRQNYSSDPTNDIFFDSFPEFHGLGISGLELADPQEIKPFRQPYQSVLRAYSSINGDIGITFSSATDFPLELPQSREVEFIPDYGQNCADPLCTTFSSTHYGSAAPTAEVSRFAAEGRSTDNRQRRYQDDSVQLSPACLSGIDLVLRTFLRAGAPDLPFYVQEGQGILTQEGGIYYDTSSVASRPIIQARQTIQTFVPEKDSPFKVPLLPPGPRMLSETIIITEKLCYLKYLGDDMPKNSNGQVNQNSFFSLLLSKKIIGKDAAESYSVNNSALLDPINLEIAILLKCAAYGYYPLWLQNNVTEITLPENNGYILTTGSLEDISMASGNFTSLSISEDIFVEGNLIIGSSTQTSKFSIYSSIDMNVGVRFSGSFDSESTVNIGPGSSIDETYVFLPDTFGTLVVGDLPPTLGSLDMLQDSDLKFESTVQMGADSVIGGLGENTIVTLYASLLDPCPFRFARSANSIAEIVMCTKDPSGDNTLFLPDESGTFLTTSQLNVLNNITSLERVSLEGKSVVMDVDFQIGGTSANDILTLNANIMGLNAITFDGIGVKDGKTLALSAGEPTAQNEITLPDCSGTVITSANFPTVFERLTVMDSFVTRGLTRLIGDKISIGSSDPSAPSQIKIYADLIGDYPLVFDGASESSEPLSATTSFAMQQFAGENIITFPDTSGVVITSASVPSIISTDQEYRLTAEGFAVYSETISIGLATEPFKCVGCFSFADSSLNTDFVDSPSNDTFSIKASGGVYLFTGKSRAGNNIGASLLPNSGSWSYLSDKNAKQNITPINTTDVLRRLLDHVPISTWYYKEDTSQTWHMGPYAQDFGAAFAVGSDPTRIVSSDMDGAILGAVQGMYEEVEVTRKKVVELEKLISELDERIELNNLKLHNSLSQMSRNNNYIANMLGELAFLPSDTAGI